MNRSILAQRIQGLGDMRHRSTGVGVAAALLAIVLMPSVASAEYRLFPGDSIEIAIASMSDMKFRAQIGPDGEASFPLIGEVSVAGLTLPDARRKVQTLLPTKEVRRRSPEGREYPVIITSDEISLSIVEYRPVYLNGDVSKPGEQSFRPGMTIRQAVALAGGYDVARFRMENPFLEQADLTGQYKSLWAEFAKEQANVVRLKAELADKPFDKDALAKAPIPASLAADIGSIEADRMQTRGADFEKQKTYLRNAAKQEEQRSASLSEQQRKEQEGTRVDSDDLQRLQGLLERGNVTIPRVMDAKRAVLYSSTRELQTTVQLAQAQRERADLGRKLDQVSDQRHLAILGELQDANVRLAGLRARLEAVSEKLTYTGLVRSQLVRGKGSEPGLVIIRTTAKGRERLDQASEDAALQPGDVVEVSLQADLMPPVPAQ